MDNTSRKRLWKLLPEALNSLRQKGVVEDFDINTKHKTVTVQLDPSAFAEPSDSEKVGAAKVAAKAASRAKTH